MKVLLINPPPAKDVRIVREGRCMQRQEAWGTSWAPLTLAIVAALLRDSGFSVALKDCPDERIDFPGLKKIIRGFRPGLIIVNTSTPSIKGDLRVAALSKEINPAIKTIFFGIHVTVLAGEIFNKNPVVEFIAAGEPEFVLRDFAVALRDGKPLSRVRGLIYRLKEKIVYNERMPFIEDLDELPFPAWDLVNIDRYRLPIKKRRFLLVLTKRGCPRSCGFCASGAYYGKKPRLRSWKRVVEEIKHVRGLYGVNDFLFWSEDAISDRQQIYDISKALAKEAPGTRWVCNGRVDMVDEGLLRVMKEGGCWMIGYGIESGSQRVLDLMGKNIRIEDMERAVMFTKKAGIEVTGHVITGYPGEKEEEALETIRLLKRLELDYAQVYCCVPFPGSLLYEEAMRSGWITSSDWEKFEQNFSVLDTPSLSRRQVMELREKVIRAFYLRPSTILKMLRKIRSGKEMVSLFAFAARYFADWARRPGRFLL